MFHPSDWSTSASVVALLDNALCATFGFSRGGVIEGEVVPVKVLHRTIKEANG